MNSEAQQFLVELNRENAEAFKARIIRRVEEVLANSTVSPERINEIKIILPDEEDKH
jgi:hypothetical protein